jgi:tRNA1(Val) A37 N6-methylase TrmN6
MDQLINNLLLKFNIKEIEESLIQFFVEKNNLRVKENKLILGILKNKGEKIIALKEIFKIKIDKFDINDLEKAFELLIPSNDRKINGAFFTPPTITNYIARELIVSDNQSICDPSCGCGAFLIAAIDVLKNKFNKRVIDIIENNVFGVDILDYSVRRCQFILALLALLNKEDKEKISFNIHQEDSLNVDWNKLFYPIMHKGGFDIVIGNPPYVKYQDLPDELRKDLFRNWKTLKTGTYNLYFAFFELGISLIKDNGKLGYITPNNYFTSLAGINLREFLQLNRHIEKIIDFNHLKIFDAQTYTCITFLSKKKKSYFLFERTNDKKRLSRLSDINFSRIKYEELDAKKWRLLREIDQKNIKLLETSGIRLGTIVDINVGIATCKDNIYFIDGNTLKDNFYKKEINERIFFIEKGITRPIVKISEFQTQKELSENKRRIIFPYYVRNGKAYLIPKDELQREYPKCYEYLLFAKQELEGRDKGKVEYEEWYAYARTQGLTSKGEKLLTPTFSSKPRFLIENDPNTLFCNGYGLLLVNKDGNLFNGHLSLEILSKILNSKIMAYYIDKTSVSIEGGYPCYQKNFIERFSIPNFNDEEIEYLRKEKDITEIDTFLMGRYKINIY